MYISTRLNVSHQFNQIYSLETNFYEAKFVCLKKDKNLNWNNHIDDGCNKISSGLFALIKMSKICPERTLKPICFALFHSHISFGLVLYSGTSFAN